jgi:hypothetical protein
MQTNERSRIGRTSRAASVSSTSATSHQLSRLHNGPRSPGRTTKYDLNSAVSTTWAHRTSCSGVSDENGASGIPRSESLEISDKATCRCDCTGVMWKASSAPRSFWRLSGRYRKRLSSESLKSSTKKNIVSMKCENIGGTIRTDPWLVLLAADRYRFWILGAGGPNCVERIFEFAHQASSSWCWRLSRRSWLFDIPAMFR